MTGLGGKDLSGLRFGRWIVVARTADSATRWDYQCDCGTKRSVLGGKLRAGLSASCGCYARELSSKRATANVSHGLHGHPLYNCWKSMVRRCTDQGALNWADYGGRGIKVCDRWRGHDGLKRFIDDMGPKPSARHSLDRVDNNLGYSPENCRWATPSEQQRNTRQTRLTEESVAEIRSRRRTGEELASLAKAFGVAMTTIHAIVQGRTWKNEEAA